MYHPQRDTDRLQIPRTEGEWRLLSIADCGETEVQNFSLSQHQLEERLLGFSRSESIVSHYEGTEPTFKKQKKEERQKQQKEKQLHGKSVSEKQKTFEERNRRLDICGAKASPQNEQDKKEH